jgi:pyruvate/2-oxoglutarate/acetoin dehydrogenase E1 component
MCALVNHVPIWYKKGLKLPITYICQVGKGMGQGAQHSKDLTSWFQNFEGWTVKIPETPQQAFDMLQESIKGDKPVMYVIHRELFDLPEGKKITVSKEIKLCGASQEHESDFYGAGFVSAKSKLLQK